MAGQITHTPRIVLLTGVGPEHRYVANRLASGLELAGIVVDHGKQAGVTDTARRLWRRYTMPQLLSRVCLSMLRRLWGDRQRRASTVKAILGTDQRSEFPKVDKVFHVHGVNSPDCVNAVRSLQPDILLGLTAFHRFGREAHRHLPQLEVTRSEAKRGV